jgi:hypothetical protein
MKSKTISQDFLIIAILTLITILAWVGTDIYRISTRKNIPRVLEEQLTPLSPKINTQILDQLGARRAIP